MLTFDEDYVFALDVIKRFGGIYPKFEGIVAPYHGSRHETEGMTITLKDPTTDISYRISLCGRWIKTGDTSVISYCVRVSQYKLHYSGRYNRLEMVGKVDKLLSGGSGREFNINLIVDCIKNLLELIKFPME